MHVVIGGNTPMHPIHRECFVLYLWFEDQEMNITFETEAEVIRVHKLLGMALYTFATKNYSNISALFRNNDFYDTLGYVWPFSSTSFDRQNIKAWQWLWYNDAGVAHEITFGVT